MDKLSGSRVKRAIHYLFEGFDVSIRTRLSLLWLVFIAPLLGALVWYARFTYDAAINTARNNLQSLARLAVLDLDRAANGGAQLLSGLGHVPLLHGPKTGSATRCSQKNSLNFKSIPASLRSMLRGIWLATHYPPCGRTTSAIELISGACVRLERRWWARQFLAP